LLSLEVPRKDVLQQDWRREPYMAFYRITADESGKLNSKAEYTSFCGYVGLAAEWSRFEMEWLSCQFKWQVPAIHMAKIYRPESDPRWEAVRNKWGERWEPDRDTMLQEFARIIDQAQLMCVGSVVDSEYFRSMPDSPYKQEARNPIFLSLQILLVDSIESVRLAPQPISIVIDDDREYAMECYKWINVLKDTLPAVKKFLVGICFANDDAYPGVQAADMIAYEARKRMVEKKANPDSEPSEMYARLTHLGRTQPKLVDAYWLEQLNTGKIQV